MDIAFVGRAVAVVEGAWIRERIRLHGQGFGSTIALLAVERGSRGPARSFFVVIGGTGQADCKLHFVPGPRI